LGCYHGGALREGRVEFYVVSAILFSLDDSAMN